MCEKICKNCVWISKLRHNFEVGIGFIESFCCTNMPELIIEVKPTETCEEFFERIDANELIRKYT
jgi:hypothetical protein